MARRAKRSVLSLHRQIAKDTQKTIQANSPGGRYYVPSLAEQLHQVTQQVREEHTYREQA